MKIHQIHVVPQESWRRVNPNRGKTKRNPLEEYLGIPNLKEDPSWREKEVIPRCQRECFAPTKFEIQIRVWNFGHEVEDSEIWRNWFLLCKAQFFLWADEVDSIRTLLCFLKTFVLPLDQLIALPRYQLIALLVSFLLPLESISQNPGLPGRTGNILVKKFS